MRDRLIGAHDVPYDRLWSVARVRSVFPATLLPMALGLWIGFHDAQLFQTPAWQEMKWLMDGHIWLLSWIIFIGGLCGILGLVGRVRALSLASCAICFAWFSWISAFLWYANFTDSPNILALCCLYPMCEYVYRAILLARPPKQGEEYGPGW